MGNKISPCCYYNSRIAVKLIFWEGATKLIKGKCLAGEIMFRFPNRIICHAESFYIGHRIPALSINDELMLGQTYFVLPVDQFAFQVLSSKSLATMASAHKGRPVKFGSCCPFQYVKGVDGRVVMKVSPEFMIGIISGGGGRKKTGCEGSPRLCSTPELQKHYTMLVCPKEQVWSPKLETISECATRRSPYKRLRFDWRSETA